MRPIHPIHAILLSFPLPLFLGALLSDLAYGGTYEMQWSHFAAWLIAAGVLFGTFVVVWAVVDLVRDGRRRSSRALAYALALAAMWVLGLINGFVHAKDAWAMMPEGLYLSVVVTLLALMAAWIGFSGVRTVEAGR